MKTDNPVLSVKGLKTSFAVGKQRLQAVNDVSFDVHAGRTLCIVGESGCGKSVTAHSLLQLLPPNGRIDGGEAIYFKDNAAVDILKLPPKSAKLRALREKEIGMVFQDPMSSLNPVYRVGDQVMEKILRHKLISRKEARAKVVDLLSQLNIPEPAARFDDYPHQLSGGMKQRIMIAIAIINDPLLLIADEPTTALDVTIQAQILQILRNIQRDRNTGVILITHNMGIVAEIADDIAVMYMGRIVERGSVRQVFTRPAHPYTQALMNSVPVLGINRGERLKSIRGVTPDPLALPAGCAFAPRCDYATAQCAQGHPGKTELETGDCAYCFACGKGGARV